MTKVRMHATYMMRGGEVASDLVLSVLAGWWD